MDRNQSTIKCLLLYIDNRQTIVQISAPIFIRCLHQAIETNSSGYPNLLELKKDYQEYLGNETWNRIIEYKDDKTDAKRARQTLVHYNWQTKKQLFRSLTFWNRAHYLFSSSIDSFPILTTK